MTKRKKGKLVWITAIPGCRRKQYLNNWLKSCGRNRKKIKTYHIGQMMFPWAKQYCGLELDPRYVLNTPEHTLSAIRGGVFESILGGPERDRLNRELEENDAVIISVHNRFFWKECLDKAYNASFLKRFDPDVFVNFIDPSEVILEELNSREQWIGQRLTEHDVLTWQELEVEDMKSFPEWLGMEKKWYVLPTQQPTSTFYDLLFKPWRLLMYAQMPISHLGDDEKEREEKLKKIWCFINRVAKYFPIITPLLIDTGNVIYDDKGEKKKHSLTVKRDNKWFIGSAKISVANIIEPVFTVGVIDEIREAQDTNKESWAIFKGDRSPFFEHRVTPDRFFQNEREFFRFLINEFIPFLKQKWEEEHGEKILEW